MENEVKFRSGLPKKRPFVDLDGAIRIFAIQEVGRGAGDGAIKLACSNYKSALSNFKAGNIKIFRIRYWNYNKPIKIMDLEKSDFSKNTIRNKVLGKVIGYYNGKEFDFNVDNDCKLQKNNNKYN